MTSAITATGLRKSFGGKIVFDGIDLEVGAGTTFSLLGPNGAGKTTTVQIMSTLVHADGKWAKQHSHRLGALAVAHAFLTPRLRLAGTPHQPMMTG